MLLSLYLFKKFKPVSFFFKFTYLLRLKIHMQLYRIIQGDLVRVSVASPKGNILQNCSVSQNIDIMSYVHACVCVCSVQFYHLFRFMYPPP